MAKLYFRYSAMNAGKTLDLIKVAYIYAERGKNALIINSIIDKRAGENLVKSRTGFSLPAISVSKECDLFELVEKYPQIISCLLIDEIHFFTEEQIDEITDIVDYLKIPVICYGLRTDYRGELFPSSAKLLGLADTMEELKTICHCGKKATFNMLISEGEVVKHGDQIVVDDNLGFNSKYISVCRLHFKEEMVDDFNLQ